MATRPFCCVPVGTQPAHVFTLILLLSLQYGNTVSTISPPKELSSFRILEKTGQFYPPVHQDKFSSAFDLNTISNNYNEANNYINEASTLFSSIQDYLDTNFKKKAPYKDLVEESGDFFKIRFGSVIIPSNIPLYCQDDGELFQPGTIEGMSRFSDIIDQLIEKNPEAKDITHIYLFAEAKEIGTGTLSTILKYWQNNKQLH